MLQTTLLGVGAYCLAYVLVVGIYALPLLLALKKRHPKLPQVLFWNLALGWTVIGWGIAFRIALSPARGSVVSPDSVPDSSVDQPMLGVAKHLGIDLMAMQDLLARVKADYPPPDKAPEKAFPLLQAVLAAAKPWEDVEAACTAGSSEEKAFFTHYQGLVSHACWGAWVTSEYLDDLDEEAIEQLFHRIQLVHPPTYQRITASLYEEEEEKWATRFGYRLFDEVAETLQNRPLETMSTEEKQALLARLHEANDKQVNDLTRSKIYRLLGEVSLALAEESTALGYFEAALQLNPKVGVKKLATKLKQSVLLEHPIEPVSPKTLLPTV